jgi:hypothetical protein
MKEVIQLIKASTGFLVGLALLLAVVGAFFR